MNTLKVEIWSDVVCPWCYIGKRRFETALSRFAHKDQVEVTWRSFELDQNAPQAFEGTANERLAKKYGMSVAQASATHDRVTSLAAAEGLQYHYDIARYGNTFRAHQLIHFAEAHGLQDAMKERLMKAYFTEGEFINDAETLARLAGEIGLNAREAQSALEKNIYTDAVRQDEERAVRIGINGVPFFLFQEKYGVSGAQTPDVLLNVLEKTWDEINPE